MLEQIVRYNKKHDEFYFINENGKYVRLNINDNKLAKFKTRTKEDIKSDNKKDNYATRIKKYFISVFRNETRIVK